MSEGTWTSEEAYREAQARIRQVIETRAKMLDLGDLPLEEIPDELQQATWLEGLSLGASGFREVAGKYFLAADESFSRWRLERSLNSIAKLAALRELRQLDLSGCRQLTDIDPLRNLTALASLNLSSCEQLTDIAPLRNLTALASLNLAGCWQLTDINPLRHLPAVASLNLFGCRQLTDIVPLRNLTALASLNLSWCEQLTDIDPLRNLTTLASLYLSGCQQLTDIDPLRNLTALTSLDLAWCRNLKRVECLPHLSALRRLDLVQCTGISSFEVLTPLLPQLEELDVHGCRFSDLPAEILGEYDGADALPAIRAYYADLDTEARQDREVKVFILGNGGVGKTQLCRRLQNLDYDPKIPSTHGVQLGAIEIPLPDGDRPVRGNVWDFGGQDIYHGSHALFLHGQAIFLILWTPETEQGVQTRGELTMAHRPLAYWLDYVRQLAGTDSPVLVVQSQCERNDQRVPRNDLPNQEFRLLKHLAVSARTTLGLTELKGALEVAVAALYERRPPVRIGKGRAGVRDHVRKLLAKDQKQPNSKRKHRILTLDQFQALCDQIGGVSSATALLEFLHPTGVLLYRPTHLPGRVILDQTWALDAIYTLFDRDASYPMLRNGGRFTLRDLELVAWKKQTSEERELFLDLMQACGICFPTRKLRIDRQEFQEYIAPELLPDWEGVQSQLRGRIPDAPADVTDRLHYKFLHDGVLRGILSRIGREAQDNAEYWKFGVWMYEEQTRSRLLLKSELHPTDQHPAAGTITLEAWGEQPGELCDRVIARIQEIQVGNAPEIVLDPRARRAAGPGVGGMRHGKTIGVASAELDPRLQPESPLSREEPLQAGPLPEGERTGPPEVFVSYAWGEDKTEAGRERQKTVEDLCDKLKEWGYLVRRDSSEIRNGGIISDYMRRLSKSDRVLVILSEKYLRSVYCLSELYAIYQRAQGEEREFLKRVIPTSLQCARFATIEERDEHAEYWDNRYESLRKSQTRNRGNKDAALVREMGRWAYEISDMLACVNNVLHPKSFEDIAANDFQAIREMLSPVV